MDLFFEIYIYYIYNVSSILAKSPKIGIGSASKHLTTRILKPRLFITDGCNESLTGVCLYFIKCSKSKAISTSNMHTVCGPVFNILFWEEVNCTLGI